MLDPDYDGRSLFPRQVFFIADVMKVTKKLIRKIRPDRNSYSIVFQAIRQRDVPIETSPPSPKPGLKHPLFHRSRELRRFDIHAIGTFTDMDGILK